MVVREINENRVHLGTTGANKMSDAKFLRDLPGACRDKTFAVQGRRCFVYHQLTRLSIFVHAQSETS
jgi:hypothetical protein